MQINSLSAMMTEKNEQESHQNPIFSLISKLINFGLLVFILYYFLVKIIDLPGSFKNTFKNLSSEIQNAQESKEAAMNQIKNLEVKLANIEKEIEEIKNESNKIIENEKNKILLEADSEIKRLQSIAKHEIEWKTNEAIKKLKQQMLDEAITLSKEIIKLNLNKTDQDMLIKKFLADLKSKSNN
jgi:F-type H+-transporting ATPase subunit b